MYTELDRQLIQALKYSKKNKPILDQVDSSLQKIFSDIAKNLLYNKDIQLTKGQKEKLKQKRKHITKIAKKSKNNRKNINQVGGFLLPFVLPLLANLLA